MFSLGHWPYVASQKWPYVPAQKQRGEERPAPFIAAQTETVGADSFSRACCCPAKPQVMVFIPAPTGSCPDRQVEILLCMHHFRVSTTRLADIGAVAVRADGGRPLLLGPSLTGHA